MNNRSSYLAEWKDEGKRLAVKTDRNQLIGHFDTVALNRIRSGAVIVDAGAGVGIASHEMGKYLRKCGRPVRQILMLDMSVNRLQQARGSAQKRKLLFKPLCCDLISIPIADKSVDFVFCRFLFEYLKNPADVFNELYRILKPGGKMVIGDVDYGALTFYPINAVLKRMVDDVFAAFAQSGFDLYAGRKLYHYFHRKKMNKIKVHVNAHNVMYGPLSENAKENWAMKIKMAKEQKLKGIISTEVDLEKFEQKFLKYLYNFERFSYTPYIMVEGVR